MNITRVNLYNNPNENYTNKNITPLKYDSVSFSGKFYTPDDKKHKYATLYNNSESNLAKLMLLLCLKEDKDVSDSYKSKILLADGGKSFFNTVIKAKNDYDYEILKAILNASPNDKVTRKLLLTTSDAKHNASIPLHYADERSARILLDASLDTDTIKAQLFALNANGRTPLYSSKSDFQAKKVMLDYCDYKEKQKLLVNFNSINGLLKEKRYIELDAILSLAPDNTTRNDMLSASSKDGDNLLHNKNLEQTQYLLSELRKHPDTLKTMLLQRNKKKQMPISKCDIETAVTLLNASPDKETLKAQLLEANMPARHSENAGLYILTLSPDDETIMKQLFMPNNNWHKDVPTIGRLNPVFCIKTLKALNSVEMKKQLLNSTWTEVIHTGKHSSKKVKNSFKDYFISSCNSKRTEFMSDDAIKELNMQTYILANEIIGIVEDESTTKDEAIKLLTDYKPIMPGYIRNIFDSTIANLSTRKFPNS